MLVWNTTCIKSCVFYRVWPRYVKFSAFYHGKTFFISHNHCEGNIFRILWVHLLTYIQYTYISPARSQRLCVGEDLVYRCRLDYADHGQSEDAQTTYKTILSFISSITSFHTTIWHWPSIMVQTVSWDDGQCH